MQYGRPVRQAAALTPYHLLLWRNLPDLQGPQPRYDALGWRQYIETIDPAVLLRCLYRDVSHGSCRRYPDSFRLALGSLQFTTHLTQGGKAMYISLKISHSGNKDALGSSYWRVRLFIVCSIMKLPIRERVGLGFRV
jgi:hypothetical protein